MGNPGLVADTAARDSSLQGATSSWPLAPSGSTAARCPVSTHRRSTPSSSRTLSGGNFLCNLGFGDAEKLYPRYRGSNSRTLVASSEMKSGRARVQGGSLAAGRRLRLGNGIGPDLERQQAPCDGTATPRSGPLEAGTRPPCPRSGLLVPWHWSDEPARAGLESHRARFLAHESGQSIHVFQVLVHHGFPGADLDHLGV